MNQAYSQAVKTAQEYYNSDDADNFYFHIWGGQDIHVGSYASPGEDIASASERTVRNMAAQLQGIGADTRVIDIGAGYGGAARWLAQTHLCHVSCLNLSEAQNARNRILTDAAGLSDVIEVTDGSFEDIPYPDAQFDVAWSQDAILHSGRRSQVLAEVDRVLKPGGEFIFTDPMQADDCPAGVLQPVLDRIHLQTLGSFAFYREQARQLGWEEIGITDLTDQLVTHYSRVREELSRRREELQGKVSDAYTERMIAGLGNWIDAGRQGYLAWGILHFRKPA
jgi:sarcosine/dimethylglycine N-methyltransferase